MNPVLIANALKSPGGTKLEMLLVPDTYGHEDQYDFYITNLPKTTRHEVYPKMVWLHLSVVICCTKICKTRYWISHTRVMATCRPSGQAV